MELSSIHEQLQPFLTAPLAEFQLRSISMYVDMVLRWNARVNLTAVRQPGQILTRHFGESIFTAQHLFPAGASAQRRFLACPGRSEGTNHLIDLGSGAGFPGLPIKICYPELRVTLIDSSHKKATFLREVVRSLALTNVDVFCGRAESYAGAHPTIVTVRAVERFDKVLPVAANLVASGGRMALLIGQDQCARAQQLTPSFCWNQLLPLPLSENRVLLIGSKPANQSSHESS
jgi:16S rRNA (guanine527-N7)-methyltransferase